MADHTNFLGEEDVRRIREVVRVIEGGIRNPDTIRAAMPRLGGGAPLVYASTSGTVVHENKAFGFIYEPAVYTNPDGSRYEDDFNFNQIGPCWIRRSNLSEPTQTSGYGKIMGQWHWPGDPNPDNIYPVVVVGGRCVCPQYCGGRTELLTYAELFEMASDFPTLAAQFSLVEWAPEPGAPDPTDSSGCVECAEGIEGNCNVVERIDVVLNGLANVNLFDFIGEVTTGFSVGWAYDSDWYLGDDAEPCAPAPNPGAYARIQASIEINTQACTTLTVRYRYGNNGTPGNENSFFEFVATYTTHLISALKCCGIPYGEQDLFQHNEVHCDGGALAGCGTGEPLHFPNLNQCRALGTAVVLPGGAIE